MENGVTGVITKHVQKHVEVHHKNEQENATTQHQLTVEFHVQDLMKIRKLAELPHAQLMENGVTGVIMKHVQKHVEVHHKNEQENATTQHQLTVEFHVQDLTKIRKLVELLHAQSTENGLHGLHMDHAPNLAVVDKKLALDHALTQHQNTMELLVQEVHHKLHHATHKIVQSTETGPNGLHMDHAANPVHVDKKLALDHALAQHQNTMELLVQEVHHKLHHATHKTVQLMPNGAAGVVTEVVQRLVTLEHKQDQDHAVVIDTVEEKLVQDQALQAEAVMSMLDAHTGLVTCQFGFAKVVVKLLNALTAIK